MFTAGGVVHLRNGDAALIDGWVITARGDEVEAVFNNVVDAAIGTEVALFVTAHNKFWRQPAHLVSITPGASGAVMGFKFSGPLTHSCQRASYRVRPSDEMKVTFGGYKECEVHDVSATGVGINMPLAPKIGDIAALALDCHGYKLQGAFRVRRAAPLADKRFRVGLSAAGNTAATIRQLEKLVAELQRWQLRMKKVMAS